MGRLIFVIEQKVLLIFLYLLAAHVLLKIKASIEPCLVSVVVLMRGCSGMGEFDAGKYFFKSQYTHYKNVSVTYGTLVP